MIKNTNKNGIKLIQYKVIKIENTLKKKKKELKRVNFLVCLEDVDINRDIFDSNRLESIYNVCILICISFVFILTDYLNIMK